ncbi:MAG: hypothetical protein DIZ80_03245 [endosymbiont of Galathealinum brachiosum]|uniref:Uncharacterized protein n=1 Tax=endosymbiont of Galathealinum brachiosum TaxID=2200906 RepID=A0A370DHV5_9GAMM|nr:MAG: hypothetical protein DIZ80_03245 [endosymbiont of Galathealinum brachiosum]
MYIRFILFVLMLLSFSVSHAGAGKIFSELLEPIVRKGAKYFDEAPIGVGPVEVVGSVQGQKYLYKDLLSRLTKDKNSVEYKVASLVIEEVKKCNVGVNDYLEFLKINVHNESPIKNALFDEESIKYMNRYKVVCDVKDIKFLGSGESVDEINEFAYAEVTGVITVPGLFEIQSRSIDSFKLLVDNWKVWDVVALELDAEMTTKDWWMYDREAKKCSILDDKEDVHPLALLEQNDELKCSTKGVINDSLLVRCNSEELRSKHNIAYFTNRKACEKFGNSIREYKSLDMDKY